jgi:hypothetical protein
MQSIILLQTRPEQHFSSSRRYRQEDWTPEEALIQIQLFELTRLRLHYFNSSSRDTFPVQQYSSLLPNNIPTLGIVHSQTPLQG